MAATMKIRRYIPDHTITTVPALAILAAVHFFVLRGDPVENGAEFADTAPLYYEHWQRIDELDEFDIDGELRRLELDDAARDQRIRELLEDGHYQRARTELLQVAAIAVLHDDQQRLGDTLLLLGEVAIYQQELAAAEIYLQEALYLAIKQEDVTGAARCYQLLGKLNVRARELARRAANTYDQLWMARNAMARGLYQGVGEDLDRVIEDNLAIRRYGAAADAWEAKAALHDKVHDGYQAQLARIEAARLFASIGQMTQVQRLLDSLDASLMTAADLSATRQEIETLFERHRQDTIKSSQAHDYQMLYHHYLRRGQVERAWQFRIKSSQTLAETSDRSLFQRQADVIAVLYNSNFAMQRARQYLDQADSLFRDGGDAELLEQTRQLQAQIY